MHLKKQAGFSKLKHRQIETYTLMNIFKESKLQMEGGISLAYQELGVVCGDKGSSVCKQVSIP